MDGRILLTFWHHLKGGNADIRVAIIDASSGDYEMIIPYDECLDENYKYRTVASVDYNFKGEIYAMMLFYNTPMKVSDDDKIAIYRWTRK